MRITARRRLALERFLAIALAATVLGCGRPSGAGRLPVYGTVAHPAGDKINGSISFIPDQGRSGLSAVTSLVDGEYRFDRSNGPAAGLHRVIVVKAALKEKAFGQPAGSKGRPPGTKGASAPAPANQWTLSADVPAKGPYKIDFKLP